MALPTPQKTYTHTVGQRVTFVSLLQTMQETQRALKDAYKAAGFTVKGSSNGVTAAMDGVDRWTVNGDVIRGTGTGVAQSWIILEHATGMGGTEILLTYQGAADQNCKISISQGGNWVVAGTATFQPTAIDECIIQPNTAIFVDSTASLDRIWNFAISTDRDVSWFLVARNNVFVRTLMIGLATPAVIAPATWTVPVWGVTAAAATFTITSNLCSMANAGAIKLRVSNVDRAAGFATESTAEASSSNAYVNIAGVWEYQGNQYVFGALSLLVTLRGKAGNVIDLWIHGTTPVDGDTWPSGGSNLFITTGDFALPWDGSTPVMF